MTIQSIALICVNVVLFSALCGVLIGSLHKKSHPGDPSAAVARGLVVTGATIVGACAVVGFVLVLAKQSETAQPSTPPSTTQSITAPSPTGAPAAAR